MRTAEIPIPGKLGVVEEGAYADLLLVDGDPIADIELVADPETNFLVIMKDGLIFKNTSHRTLSRRQRFSWTDLQTREPRSRDMRGHAAEGLVRREAG